MQRPLKPHKPRKDRTKKQNPFYDKECWYYDGQGVDGKHIHECFYPWNTYCEGDRHKCFKLKLHWFASLPKNKRKYQQEKYSKD